MSNALANDERNLAVGRSDKADLVHIRPLHYIVHRKNSLRHNLTNWAFAATAMGRQSQPQLAKRPLNALRGLD
jgi:hypothetical protein